MLKILGILAPLRLVAFFYALYENCLSNVPYLKIKLHSAIFFNKNIFAKSRTVAISFEMFFEKFKEYLFSVEINCNKVKNCCIGVV